MPRPAPSFLRQHNNSLFYFLAHLAMEVDPATVVRLPYAASCRDLFQDNAFALHIAHTVDHAEAFDEVDKNALRIGLHLYGAPIASGSRRQALPDQRLDFLSNKLALQCDHDPRFRDFFDSADFTDACDQLWANVQPPGARQSATKSAAPARPPVKALPPEKKKSDGDPAGEREMEMDIGRGPGRKNEDFHRQETDHEALEQEREAKRQAAIARMQADQERRDRDRDRGMDFDR